METMHQFPHNPHPRTPVAFVINEKQYSKTFFKFVKCGIDCPVCPWHQDSLPILFENLDL
jgi:hypothetical protein